MYDGVLSKLDPSLQGVFKQIQALATAHGRLSAEIEKNRAKLQEQVNVFNSIRDAVDAGTQRFRSQKAAITALAKEIDGLIAGLEKTRTPRESSERLRRRCS